MEAERAVFDPVNAEAAADVRAEADIAAGRVVDQSQVADWLAKWGTSDEVPAPREWLG